jgi:hypothetical protein
MAKGKGALRIAIEDFIETYGFGERIREWFMERVETSEAEIYVANKDAIDEAAATLAELGPVGKSISDVIKGQHQGGLLGAAGFAGQMGMSAASGLLAPIMRMLNYTMDKRLHSGRADPGTAFVMARRDPEFEEPLIEGLRELGWHDDYIKLWEKVTKPVIPEGDLITLWYRHEELRGSIEQELGKRGWTPERIERLLLSRKILPGIQDLISMAVREAWNEETVERFEYDADFPQQVVKYAEQQGMDVEWVKNYWRAHWQLPSISAGYEMVHRLRPGTTDNPFTIDDLRTLLRTADIPTFFRDRLIEVSYAPYTRVDIRRMYQAGILDFDEVVSAYKDIGYDDEKAANLAAFAVSLGSQESRDLTKAMITGAYKRSIFGRDAAIDALVGIGFRTEDADLALAQIDYDLARDKIDDDIERVKFLYMEGEYQEPDVYVELGHLNLPSAQVADLIVSWEIARRKKRALPSRGDLEDFYRKDLISLADLREGLSKRRYIDDDIELYLRRLDMKIAEEAAVEAERAQKEEQRLAAADLSDEYQRIKAGIDVDIAAVKLAIADNKLAMWDIEEPAEVDAVKKEQLELKDIIAQLQLQKAQVKYQEKS